MKTKISVALAMLLLLAVLAAWTVSAQGPQPPEAVSPTGRLTAPEMLPPWEPEFGKPFGPQAPFARLAGEGAGVGATAIPLGQPGLSFRYVETFGVTEEPYPADGEHLTAPAGLFVDASDRLYVVENEGFRMLRFDASGANSLILGHAGLPWHHDDYLSWPTDVAVDSDGNIWVVFTSAVKKFSPSGEPLLTIPTENPWEGGNDDYHFDGPFGIAFDAAGRLFVSDTNNHRIQVYDVSGDAPSYLFTIGVTGEPKTDDSGFNNPHHIAFDSLNRLYIVDGDNYRVQRCTQNPGTPETWSCSTFYGVTGEPGSDLTHIGYARGIAVSATGVYIADSINYRVLKCDFDGNCTHFAGITGERGWDNARFWWPEDVAVDSAGNVYVSDWDNHRVQKFDSAGTFIGTIGVTRVPYLTDATHLNRPWGIAVAPDGSIYVTENWGLRLVKMNAAGVQQWTVGEAGVYGSDKDHFGDWWGGPEGNPAIDASGRIYVPDTANNRVQIFNPDGSFAFTLGSYGTGQYEFDCPAGVAISPVNRDIFAVDRCNQRVQVFTQDFLYKATIGVLDETGTDNQHFNWPWGVAVDTSGSVYVADTDNHRVQKCTANGTAYTCSTFVGETGVSGDDFGHLHPLSVYVDGAGRVYVADEWNDRIQVFDSTGAYLTTIGGAWDSTTGGMRGPSGVAVDAQGNVYVADRDNHRIQKFAPGVPGWKQVNINGFGERHTGFVSTLDVFNGQLYAGTWSSQIWRSADGQTWNQIAPSGWPSYTAVFDAEPFGSYLYVGTSPDNGGEIWRTDGSTWEQVVSAGFGITTNYGINALAVFSNTLYAATSAEDGVMQIYRSASGDAGTWTPVVSDGFGGNGIWQDVTMDVYNSHLYIGLGRNSVAELWRTDDGVNWTSVFTDGLASNNTHVSAMAEFNGAFYIGLRNVTTGGEVWRTNDGLNFTRVLSGGLGDPNNGRPYGLIVFDGSLYLVFSNAVTGAEVWRTTDGDSWEQVSDAGWGDSNNVYADYFDKGATVFNNRLFIGTTNGANGGEVWKKTVTADFSASPTVGAPGTTVTFTNLAGGDVVTATWDFGDGSPALAVNHTNPVTHAYTTPGTYTVTLTVEDGVDTDVKVRPAYIRIAHRLFLPLVLRNR